MIANIACLMAGLALILLVVSAAESKDASARMVFRSTRGGIVYAIGVTLVVAGVLG